MRAHERAKSCPCHEITSVNLKNNPVWLWVYRKVTLRKIDLGKRKLGISVEWLKDGLGEVV
jgi:hypothetical protein